MRFLPFDYLHSNWLTGERSPLAQAGEEDGGGKAGGEGEER
jgi:hypothetical protein